MAMTVSVSASGVAAGLPKRTPIRTCVACRTPGGKRGLLRVVRLPEGAGAILDPTGKRSGRGAYICATAVCIAAALKRKALERSLKVVLSETLVAALQAAATEPEGVPEKGAATTMS